MRIGELAELVGVTTRTVRHYHRIGLLAEPARRDNGYRSYDTRDVLRLIRIRRLVELGLSLDEARDALAGDDDRELREILVEIEADLAAQEQRIRSRRERVADMLATDGDLTVPAEMATVESRDREVLEIVERAAGADAVHLWSTYDAVRGHPVLLDAAERFEALAGLAADDPAVDAVALAVRNLGLRELVPPEAVGDPAAADLLQAAMTAGLPPAQARCLELMFGYWRAESR